MKDVPGPPTQLREAHAARRLLPWIGSGLSSAVVGQELPDYERLIRRILESALTERTIARESANDVERSMANRDFKAAAALLRSELPEASFTRIVRSILLSDDPKASQHHVMLNLLGFRVFLTTNYDRVLDQIVKPQPEILAYRDFASLDTILDTELHDTEPRSPIVFKLNGDISAPSTIVLGQADSLGLFDPDCPLGRGVRSLLKKVLSEFSVLFLGYSFKDPDYRRLLIELGTELGAERNFHMALIPEPEFEDIADRTALEAHAGIRLQPFTLEPEPEDRDSYRALWQFLSQISPGRPVDTSRDAKDRSFYLTDERPAYLRQQLEFEQEANAFRYITPTLTNAFSTTEFLARVAPRELEGFRPALRNWDSWLPEVIQCMTERMHNFEAKLREGCEFRILCRQSNTEADLLSGDDVILDRYRFVLDLIENDDSNVKLRFSGPSDESRSLTSYACIVRGNETTSDVAVAYASQGTTAEYNAHVFEINTQFASDLLVTFEREWARARSGRETREILRQLLTAG